MIEPQDLSILDEQKREQVLINFNNALLNSIPFVIIRFTSGEILWKGQIHKKFYSSYKHGNIFYNSLEKQDYSFEIKYHLITRNEQTCKYECCDEYKEISHKLNDKCELCNSLNPHLITTELKHSLVGFLIEDMYFDTLEELLEEYNWKPGHEHEITIIFMRNNDSIENICGELYEYIREYIYSNIKIEGKSIEEFKSLHQYYTHRTFNPNTGITFKGIEMPLIQAYSILLDYDRRMYCRNLYNELYHYFDKEVQEYIEINKKKYIDRKNKLEKKFDYDYWKLTYFQKYMKLNPEYGDLIIVHKKKLRALYYPEKLFIKN